MHKFIKAALLGAAAGIAMAGAAGAADVVVDPGPPVVMDAPPVHHKISTSGWYLRGDIDYHWSDVDGIDYITYGPPAGTASFTTHDLDSSWSIGGGVGYKVNKYLRTDLTVDWFADADFLGSTPGACGAVCSTDVTSMSALLVLANAYVDLGTWHRVTPYVGAGIGGAYVDWDDLSNTIIGGGTTVHAGASGWRFAYALMAGASYCINDHFDADVGYRYSHIEGGRMFEFAPTVGPGFDRDITTHEVRAGLRYKFGGGQPCEPKVVTYVPPQQPPIYK